MFNNFNLTKEINCIPGQQIRRAYNQQKEKIGRKNRKFKNRFGKLRLST